MNLLGPANFFKINFSTVHLLISHEFRQIERNQTNINFIH